MRKNRLLVKNPTQRDLNLRFSQYSLKTMNEETFLTNLGPWLALVLKSSKLTGLNAPPLRKVKPIQEEAPMV